jgi:hypothetical protein
LRCWPLGSPLTHQPFLVGLDEAEFNERLQQRELPTCPPVLDGARISYWVRYVLADGRQRSIAMLHHAACFAATRWTNIYFPHDRWLGGEPVGGPLAPLFRAGIADVEVATRHWRGVPLGLGWSGAPGAGPVGGQPGVGVYQPGDNPASDDIAS